MPLDLAHLVLPGPSSTRHVVLERHRHALAAISGSDPRFADHVQLVDAARDALLQAVDERPPTR
jgi:hypothetical protein